MLNSEIHPEKGVAGNGTVSYFNYDARGHAGRVIDGPNDLTFTYDGAERLTRIRETGGGFSSCQATWTSGPRCLKEYTYGTSNGIGDYRLGKLQVSKRYNYPILGTDTYTAVVNQAYTYGGKQGRVSARDTNMTFNGGTTERFLQSWTWNDLGDVASVGYPQCAFSPSCTQTVPRTVTPSYANGFLTAVPGYASSITYHANGQVNQVTHLNTPGNSATWVTDTYTKDLQNLPRPRQIDAWKGATQIWKSGLFSFDGAGNVTKTGSSYFLYDRVSRVASGMLYTGSGGGAGGPRPFSHIFDGFGNLQSLTANGAQRNTPTAATTNRLTGSVLYDAAGNLTYWNGNTYQYDRLGQMVRMAAGSEIWLYMYDADDERVWAFKESAAPNRFDRWTLRDLDGKVLRTYEATNFVWSWSEDHVYRGSTLLASVSPAGTTQLHTDHLGTVRAATNSAGTRTAYHVYYPFGEEATSITQDTQRMKFTGHERDLGVTSSQADDLDSMHARFYNPQTGRFLSTDPGDSAKQRAPQSWNLYAYARGNPLKYIDPDGAESVGIAIDQFNEDLLEGKATIEDFRELTRGRAVMAPFAVAGGFGMLAGVSGGFTSLAVLGESLWLNPGIQGAFAAVAAGLADQGVPTARFASIVRGADAFTSGQLAQFERQAASGGIQSLLKSRQTFQNRLTQHLGKLEEIIEQGGHTSSVEREIRNFAQQINAIDEVLKGKGGYVIIQGELVRLRRK